jgi:hypothetical protein
MPAAAEPPKALNKSDGRAAYFGRVEQLVGAAAILSLAICALLNVLYVEFYDDLGARVPGGFAGLRRIYPDLPGMGRTIAPETLGSAEDVLDTLLALADEATGGAELRLIGHSAGAYYAQALSAQPSRRARLTTSSRPTPSDHAR